MVEVFLSIDKSYLAENFEYLLKKMRFTLLDHTKHVELFEKLEIMNFEEYLKKKYEPMMINLKNWFLKN